MWNPCNLQGATESHDPTQSNETKQLPNVTRTHSLCEPNTWFTCAKTMLCVQSCLTSAQTWHCLTYVAHTTISALIARNSAKCVSLIVERQLIVACPGQSRSAIILCKKESQEKSTFFDFSWLLFCRASLFNNKLLVNPNAPAAALSRAFWKTPLNRVLQWVLR